MSRRVRLVLLCEDSRHESLARGFLKGMGWETRELRVAKSPAARGSAEQWVRERFVGELRAYRERRTRAVSALVAMIDADAGDVPDRIRELDSACRSHQVPSRAVDEAVAIVVPRRNVETWLHYLTGNPVNEQDDYTRAVQMDDCRRAAALLVNQCRSGGLPAEAPPSLAAACTEYRDRIQPVRNHA